MHNRVMKDFKYTTFKELDDWKKIVHIYIYIYIYI